jgi:hypothetical protein
MVGSRGAQTMVERASKEEIMRRKRGFAEKEDKTKKRKDLKTRLGLQKLRIVV